MEWQPRQLMALGRGSQVKLFSSIPLLAELTEILSRRKFEKKIAATQLTVDQIVDLYAEFVAVVEPKPVPRIVPDPDDDVVIGTALAASADLAVTGDGGLLSVVAYEGVRIVTVRDALQLTSAFAAAQFGI